jgi:gamma-glutamylcyclotransferase (GGCT)/AIG2-like uncharacterized protein YtfP
MKTLIKLFTYGTLQGTPEKLIGYALKEIRIEEEFGIVHYPVIVETHKQEDFINGIVYEISTIELNQADLYEGLHYKRVEVLLHSNQTAWAYSAATVKHF